MKKSSMLIGGVVLILMLAGSPALARAGEGGPSEGFDAPALAAQDAQNYIPVQGKLTDTSGRPLNGNFTIVFRLYDVYTGGTALCSDSNTVKVTNGLFTSEIWGNCQDSVNGRQLYLSLEVAGNGEMEPRQPIFAVPYAWSLRPGAVVIGSVGPGAILHLENWDPSGRGLRSYAMSTTGENYGIVGASKSPAGFGGYFYNNYGGTGLLAESTGGTGLLAESTSGAAIKAAGTGVIQSSAVSYLWISGSGLRPYRQADTTTIDMDTVGGAIIRRGATTGTQNVMLPITIPGTLYGQNVTVKGLDIYFSGENTTDGITAILLRRQTGVCAAASCFATMLADGTNYMCEDGANPTGCGHHWDISSNNVLTSSSGILYLTIELTFFDDASWVDIGGVRLTLEHD